MSEHLQEVCQAPKASSRDPAEKEQKARAQNDDVMAEEEGGDWLTMRPKKKTARNKAETQQQGDDKKKEKDQRLTSSPSRNNEKQSIAKGTVRNNKPTVTASNRVSDGRATFLQLRRYLMQKAPTEYVTQTLLRLVELAQTRREDWLGEPSMDLEVKYGELRRTFKLLRADHREELSSLMSEWVVSANLAQDEVEERLRFLNLEGAEAIRGRRDDPVAVPTYLGAVLKGPHVTQDDTEENDVNHLRQLCAKPVTRVSILRQRTAEEDHILEMILKQELEVVNPPNFLVQSMNAEELAILTDLIHSLEYPLYAHIAPGQKFSNSLSREALLRLVTAGPEAALQHTQDVQQFKKEIARINLDLETRVITVTFKGKRTAEKWINWKMPFASKFLQLIDYKAQRERATLTNELVLLDYYEFTVAVRRGTMTSTDMFWTLEGGLDLRVKELRQQPTADGGINDLEWTVLVEGGACPDKLRDVAYILIDGVEVVIHHHNTYVNWPCRACHSTEHPTKYCKASGDNLDELKKKFTLQMPGALPSATPRVSLMGDAELCPRQLVN